MMLAWFEHGRGKRSMRKEFPYVRNFVLYKFTKKQIYTIKIIFVLLVMKLSKFKRKVEKD